MIRKMNRRFGSVGASAVNPMDYGRPPRPCCPDHGVAMIATSLQGRVRYRKCPVPGCDYRAKEITGGTAAVVYRKL